MDGIPAIGRSWIDATTCASFSVERRARRRARDTEVAIPILLIVLQYLFWFVAALLGIGSAGFILLPLVFRTPPACGTLRVLAAFCLGAYAWVVFLFVLCSVGFYNRYAVWIAWLACVAIAGWTIFKDPDKRVVPRTPPHWASMLGAVLLLPILATHFIGTVSPWVTGDANTYHLTIPKLYLQSGGFCDVPFSVYAKLPLSMELLFGYTMVLKDFVLARSLQIGAVLGIVLAAKAFLRNESRWPLWIAVLLFVANPWVALEMGFAYVDLFATLFFFASFVFAVEALGRDREEARSWLIMSGICAGLLAGSKANGIVGSFIVGMYVLWPSLEKLWLERAWAPFFDAARRALVFFGIPVFVMWFAWLARNYAQTGNPLFPMFYSSLGGPDDWSERVGRQFMDWVQGIGMGRDFTDYLKLPYRLIDQSQAFEGRVLAWWLALVPLCFVAAIRVPLVRPLLAITAIYFVSWAMGSQQFRLLLPALPFLCVAAGLSLYHLARFIVSRRWVAIAMTAFLVVGSRELYHVMVPHIFHSYRAWVAVPSWRNSEPELVAAPAAYEYVNKHAESDARVLLLNTNHAFYLDRNYIADSTFQASQIVDWLRPAADARETRRLLAARGVTWIVEANTKLIEYPQALTDMLENVDYATLEFTGSGHRVFRLR